MPKAVQFLIKGSRLLVGFGLFLVVGVFALILRTFFLAISAPCSACIDLSAWLNQTLVILAPGLASLTGGLFLQGQKKTKSDTM